MDRLLKAAVDKLTEADPNFQLDVVVIPESNANLVTLRQFIEGHGGMIMHVDSEALSGRVPIGQVHRLAASNLVSAVRLMRSQRMHERWRPR